MRVINLWKQYTYEVYQWEKEGEYTVTFPELAYTFNFNKEDGIYQMNVDREAVILAEKQFCEQVGVKVLDTNAEDMDAEVARYKNDYKQAKMNDTDKLFDKIVSSMGYMNKYAIRSDGRSLIDELLPLTEKYDIKDGKDIKATNVVIS